MRARTQFLNKSITNFIKLPKKLSSQNWTSQTGSYAYEYSKHWKANLQHSNGNEVVAVRGCCLLRSFVQQTMLKCSKQVNGINTLLMDIIMLYMLPNHCNLVSCTLSILHLKYESQPLLSKVNYKEPTAVPP